MINATEAKQPLPSEAENISQALYAMPSVLTALRCALADLEGILPEYNPDGGHPAWETLAELRVLVESEHLPAADWYNPATQIALVWSIEDVTADRPDLSDEQAMDVLSAVKRTHDATIGVSWDTLIFWAEELFGKAPPAPDE